MKAVINWVVALQSASLYLGCAMEGPEQEPSPHPEGGEYIGNVRDVADGLVELPQERLLSIRPDGSAYLIDQGSDDMAWGEEAAEVEDPVGSADVLPRDFESEGRPTDLANPTSIAGDGVLSLDGGSVRSTTQELEAPSVLLNGISGEDNRIPMYFREGFTQYISSDQKRTVYFSGTAECSGAFIGPRHVLTAAHCVYAGGRSYAPSVIIPGMQGNWDNNNEQDGIPNRPFGTKSVYTVVVHTNYMIYGSSEYDQAVIILNENQSWGTWFGVKSSTPPGPPSALNHRGYPSRDAPCVKSPRAVGSTPYEAPWDKECGGFQYWNPSNLSISYSRIAYTWHDTMMGQSGGPLTHNGSVYGTLIGTEVSTSRAAFARSINSLFCGAFSTYRSTAYPHSCN